MVERTSDEGLSPNGFSRYPLGPETQTAPYLRTLGLGLLLASASVLAQPPSFEEGAPLAERFTWRDYGAHFQNWAVAQSPKGLIFAANTYGVLEYDGSSWRLHSPPDSTRRLIRSLAVGPDGAIYAGGIGFIGRLATDSTRSLSIESLTATVPRAHQDFGDVWTTFSTPEGIVFQTPTHLFRWDGSEMTAWTTETRFHKAFQVGNAVIVREEGIGLRRLGPEGFTEVAGGDAFADRKVFALLPHPRGMLAAVVDEGLVVLENGREEALGGVASAYLREFRPYAGELVQNAYGKGDLYTFATLGGGVLVVDAEGAVVRIYREDAGLQPDDFVIGMEVDRQGGVWLALSDGLLRLDMFGRVTTFGNRQGLQGQGYSAARHAGQFYAGTSWGLHRLVPGVLGTNSEGATAYATFESTGKSQEQVWALASIAGDLLVGTNKGVQYLNEDRLEQIQGLEDNSFDLLQSPWEDHLVLVGMKSGVGLIRKTADGWRGVGRVAGVDGEVRSLAADHRGNVWAGLIDGGVARLQRGEGGTLLATVYRGGFASGTSVAEVDGEIVVSREVGVAVIRVKGENIDFEDQPIGISGDSISLHPRGTGGFWIQAESELIGARLDDDGIVEVERLRFDWALAVGAYTEANGVTWVLTDDGVIRHDPRVRALSTSYPAFIRRVAESSGPRETLYGGARLDWQTSREPVLTLPFETNDLRFEYAAAAFLYPHLTEYQTLLEDQQDEWTPWGREALADFTNLSEGTYTFRVRARDALGQLSDEAVFVFRILPPWYRTIWAYLGYFFAASFFLWSVVSWQVRKQRRRLSAQRVRNARATRLNARLQEINARLRHADKLKDDLLANTSHELRTPLTAVLGYAELLLDETEGETRDLAEGVWRGGTRLLSTVNSLLDMYKLQAGSMELRLVSLDVGTQVRETVRLLEPLARDRGIALAVLPDGLGVPAEVDRAALDRIVTNLVGNAIKFTDAGAVTVLLDADEEQVYLTVRDTGVGIDAEFLPRLFDPFEQASKGHGRTHEGSGLGLAIVQRLVELSRGTISVESEVGVGTAFHITLPRYASTDESKRGTDLVPPAAMSGAEILAITGGGPLAGVLKKVVEPYGRVCAVTNGTRAAREARRVAYDLVVVGAGDARDEMRRVEAVRRVPGYEHGAIIRAGGEPLDGESLEARGFTHQVTEVTDDAVVFALLEALLMKVEATVPLGE